LKKEYKGPDDEEEDVNSYWITVRKEEKSGT
jgi:hypothetical protein